MYHMISIYSSIHSFLATINQPTPVINHRKTQTITTSFKPSLLTTRNPSPCSTPNSVPRTPRPNSSKNITSTPPPPPLLPDSLQSRNHKSMRFPFPLPSALSPDSSLATSRFRFKPTRSNHKSRRAISIHTISQMRREAPLPSTDNVVFVADGVDF